MAITRALNERELRRALEEGAGRLRVRPREREVHFSFHLETVGCVNVSAIFLWPGVVRVTESMTGRLLVQSLPGQPTTPDESAQ